MPTTILVGTQWGDEGKGRAVDVLASDADVVVRCQGGANAGHTVIAGDRILKLRLIPSSILHDGVTPMIGDGVVVDLQVLLEEIDTLAEQGISCERLRVSGNAHIVMPYHRELDRVVERYLGRRKLGTTKKGIGPTYADKTNRIGLRVQDLLDRKIFEQKLEINTREKNAVLAKIYNRLPLDHRTVVEEYTVYADRLRPFITDTGLELHRALADGKHVLLEGAQGTLLDIDRGTYPFVTSSSTTAAGILAGSGLGPLAVDRVVGATKAYCTRVGEGPFPTEEDGEIGERLRGVRGEMGAEFGTVTGRSRRTGWLDGVLLRYAARVNSLSEIFLTKFDFLSGFERVKIAVAYRYKGDTFTEYPPHQSILNGAEAVYEELEGWADSVSGARSFSELPRAAQRYVRRVEEIAGVPVRFIGVGPEREQMVRMEKEAA